MKQNKLEAWPTYPTRYTGKKDNNGYNKHLSLETLSLLRHLIWIFEYCMYMKRESSEEIYGWLINTDDKTVNNFIDRQIEVNEGLYHWVILPILHKLIGEDIEVEIFEDIEPLRKTGYYEGHPSLREDYADDHS